MSSYTEKIYSLLLSKDLTTKEISQELDISEAQARTYINRLKSKNQVQSIGKKNRYKIYQGIKDPQYEKNMDNRLLHDKIDKLQSDLSFLKSLFEKGAVKIYGSKLTQTELKRLEGL